MPTDKTQPDQLSEKHQVTLILRMVVDDHSRLLHGELVDVSGRSWGHFSGWASLETVLKDCLSKQGNPET